MKKTKLLMPLAGAAALSAVVAPVIAMSSCTRSNNKVTITFDYRDGQTQSIQIQSGSCVPQPEDPIKEGFKFKGWYTDKEATKQFDFNLKITQSLTLYAAYDFIGVKSLNIKAKPTKVEYTQGETLDLSGLKIQALLSDETTVVDVPEGYYTTNPAHGSQLLDVGIITIDVMVGATGSEVHTSFDITVKPFVYYLSVESTLDYDWVPVGTVISRSDFTVTAHYSLLQSEVVTDWTCNLFPNGATSYRFTEAGTQQLKIEYSGQVWSQELNVVYNDVYSITTPEAFTLPMCLTSDDGFTSSKEITLINGGEVLDKSEYKLVAKDTASSDVISITDNVITTKAAGTAIILIKDKTGTDEIADPITVTVETVSSPSITYHLYATMSSYADYAVYSATSNKECVLPDYITHKEVDYKIRINGSSDLQNIHDLYLPHNLYGIWPGQTSNFSKLQNAYFDGTEEEWTKVEQYATLSNDFLTGVQCNDNFVQLDNSHVKAQYSVVELEKQTLALATPAFTESTTETTLQFNFGSWTTAMTELATDITFFKYYESAKDIEVYQDGTKLTVTTDYTFTRDGQSYILEFTDLSKMAGHNIVIKCHGAFLEGGFAATATNKPQSLEVAAHRVNYKVGDRFYPSTMFVNYVLTDGSKISVPSKYITSDLPEGYQFTSGDKGEKTVTIGDSIFSLSTTITLKVSE